MSKNNAEIRRDFRLWINTIPWLLEGIFSALLKKETIKHGNSAGMAGGKEGKVKDVSMALCPNKETEGNIFSKKGASGVVEKKDYKWGLIMLIVSCCAI